MLSPRPLSAEERLTLLQGLLMAAERYEENAKGFGSIPPTLEFTPAVIKKLATRMQTEAVATRQLHTLLEHAQTIQISPDLDHSAPNAPAHPHG